MNLLYRVAYLLSARHIFFTLLLSSLFFSLGISCLLVAATSSAKQLNGLVAILLCVCVCLTVEHQTQNGHAKSECFPLPLPSSSPYSTKTIWILIGHESNSWLFYAFAKQMNRSTLSEFANLHLFNGMQTDYHVNYFRWKIEKEEKWANRETICFYCYSLSTKCDCLVNDRTHWIIDWLIAFLRKPFLSHSIVVNDRRTKSCWQTKDAPAKCRQRTKINRSKKKKIVKLMTEIISNHFDFYSRQHKEIYDRNDRTNETEIIPIFTLFAFNFHAK